MIVTGLIAAAQEQEDGQITIGTIKECVNKAMELVPGSVEAIDKDQLIAQLERDYYTHAGEVHILESDEDGWEPWLPKDKADISWRYWERYRTYLMQQNLAVPVVDKIDETTDKTLGNLISPKTQGSWDRRGMVVGHVQAGKTTNYAGLICKAADVGYKVIIVLTGFHNNLRTQTQIRLEEAFVGYDITASETEGARKPVGVGTISSDPDLRVDTITNRSDKGDFSRPVANNFGMNPGGRPLVFVIKKNASVLNNLVRYLESVHNNTDRDGNHFISDMPLLLIDDEADQGSVDTKKMDFDLDGDPDKEHDPTTLNRLIRKILFIFTQSAYVGYTATPFATIFIHNEAITSKYGADLFPRSFITVMPTPSNYIGPDTVFGLIEDDGESRQSGLPIIRHISDYAITNDAKETKGWMPPKHDRTHTPLYQGIYDVPPSLKKATMAFIIGCAVRALRGQETKHNSMLIHVTRFIDVQEHIYTQVNSLMRDIQQILLYGEEGSKNELLQEMCGLWLSDFIPTNIEINDEQCPHHEWADVAGKILAAAQSILVRRINGSAGDVLDYEQNKKLGLNVIAIGGDKLSRGLTLEGLTVSYFTRPTRMYDTLMQMGRWFGYRDGFIDVCRLYAPSSLIEWFEHITDASEQLRREFLLMCEMGETPASYGQRVRTHPVLIVTSQVKMRHTVELSCSYQGSVSETIVFSRAKSDVEKNYSATEVLIKKIHSYAALSRNPSRESKSREIPGKYMWSNVAPDDVLDFLRGYTTQPHARRVNTSILAQYIETQIDNGDLKKWSVLLAGKDPNSKNTTVADISGFTTGLLERNNHPVLSQKPDSEPLFYRIRRLVSPLDESWDLTKSQYQYALSLSRNVAGARAGGEEIRVARDKSQALLILYPLANKDWTGPLESTNAYYMGFAISFPGNKSDKPIKYRVNQVYQGKMDD